jgi:hypothetical protein
LPFASGEIICWLNAHPEAVVAAMMAAAIMATAANRSRTNRTTMIPLSAPPKHRSQANAATCVGSRQLKQYEEYERCKFGRGRMIGSGAIRRLSAANATRSEKRSGPSASREVARIESDAALTDSTLDRLLQPVGWVEGSETHHLSPKRKRSARLAVKKKLPPQMKFRR